MLAPLWELVEKQCSDLVRAVRRVLAGTALCLRRCMARSVALVPLIVGVAGNHRMAGWWPGMASVA